jgi:hypothetical protein
MHIFLLDRNVISLMKDFIASEDIEAKKYGTHFIRYPYLAERFPTVEHANMLKFLLRKDVSKNFFSVITSAIEGGFGRHYDVDEYKRSLEFDGSIVRKFFCRARTDELILKNIHNMPENASVILKENKAADYESYLEQIAPYARNSADSFVIKKNKIFHTADNAGIPRSHFVVVCCLSAATGCIVARDIIKQKKRRTGDNKPKYYNVLNDIMVASRIAQFMALDKSNTYEFITLEKSLSTFISLCPVIDSSSEIAGQDVSTYITTAPKTELFPGLTEQEYEKLIMEDFGGVRHD